MRVVGADIVCGKPSFHVQIPISDLPEGVYLPSDIWFAVIGNRFQPTQYYLTNKDGQSRVVVTVTKYQTIGTANVPIQYRLSQDFLGATATGQKVWGVHLWPRYHVYTLNLSDINGTFPDDTFHLVFPAGTRIAENGKLLKSTSGGDPKYNQLAAYFRLAPLVFLFLIFLFIAFKRWKLKTTTGK
jgi:hypothetical protein